MKQIIQALEAALDRVQGDDIVAAHLINEAITKLKRKTKRGAK